MNSIRPILGRDILSRCYIVQHAFAITLVSSHIYLRRENLHMLCKNSEILRKYNLERIYDNDHSNNNYDKKYHQIFSCFFIQSCL